MSPILLTIVVVLVAVFAVAIWMDRKRRHLRDTRSAGSTARSARQMRLDGRDRGSQSGAGL